MGSNVTLKKRMLIGFSIPVLMVLFSGIFNNYLLEQVNSRMNTYVEEELPQVQALQELATNSYSFRMPVLVVVRTPEEQVRQRLEEEIGEKRKKANEAFRRFEQSIITAEGRKIFSNINEIWLEWNKIVDNIYATSEAGNFELAHQMQLEQCEPTFAEFENRLNDGLAYYDGVQNEANNSVLSTISSIKWSLMVVSAVIVLLIIGVSVAVFFNITKPIKELLEKIQLSAEQTRDASGQVSDSSQSLASGASQQAASVEETSASLEEIASMIEHNSENSNTASSHGMENKEIVDNANVKMQGLLDSMQAISTSSEKTQQIIKTIDEIAFQTNLLALNAAVEAARAGELGAGFAVVAEEVRNLAMRASDAAKQTATLIDESAGLIETGREQAGEVSQAFHDVQEISDKVSALVNEVSAGSKEQRDGIHQLNKAVQEIDKVVQTNAATAEESAAAAEELSAQSNELNHIVADFNQFMGLTAHAGNAHQTEYKSKPTKKKAVVHMAPKMSTHTAPAKKLPASKPTSKQAKVEGHKGADMQAFYDSFDIDDHESFKDF